MLEEFEDFRIIKNDTMIFNKKSCIIFNKKKQNNEKNLNENLESLMKNYNENQMIKSEIDDKISIETEFPFNPILKSNKIGGHISTELYYKYLIVKILKILDIRINLKIIVLGEVCEIQDFFEGFFIFLEKIEASKSKCEFICQNDKEIILVNGLVVYENNII
ncbi:hypothetical protein CWI36_1583p0010 [Hamiltosporidium magnivora]|uniref:Uncharacterized protein n=1 Tax=Hamiltosporidium magnivora TaxID=148818 RepID=A0A4Q9KZY4_9MICR|nr:hypothetical protein CWI36_1583p0010 [Hamiltosporidium magnivora]